MIPPVVLAAQEERKRLALGLDEAVSEVSAEANPEVAAVAAVREARAEDDAAARRAADKETAAALQQAASDSYAEAQAAAALASAQLQQAAATATTKQALHQAPPLEPPGPLATADDGGKLVHQRPWWHDAPCCGVRTHGSKGGGGEARSNAFDTPLLNMLNELLLAGGGLRKPRAYFSNPIARRRQEWSEAD